MNTAISRNLRNRVSHTFFTSNGECFYLVVHDCGELLLCSTNQYKACRLDASTVGVPQNEDGLWVMKHGWEPKLDLSHLSEDDVISFIEVTGIPATPSESLAELTKRETAWYGKERDWQSPMMRSVLTWAARHPRLAKSDYFDGLIIQVHQLVDEPLPEDQYTGF